MQGIVFIYEAERSLENRLFTVRLEERRREGATWVAAGRRRYYTARELQGAGLRFIDRELFTAAFRSETEIRQREGRFYSADEEYTFYRISPYDLKTFLDGCFCSESLCREDGRPIHFSYVHAVVPRVAFDQTAEGYTPVVSLAGRRLDPRGFEMVADPVRILSGRTVYELVRGLPVKVVRELVRGDKVPHDEYAQRLKALSRYAGKLDLRVSAKQRKKVLQQTAVTPVLDIDQRMQFARLCFRYKGFAPLDMADRRKVLFDPRTNVELHRHFKAEAAWRRRLEKRGARYRNRARGQWFLPAGKREALLADLAGEGFMLQLDGAPLRLDIEVSWEIATHERSLAVGGTVRQGGQQTDLEHLLDAYLSGQRWFDLPGGARGYLPQSLLDDLERLEERGDVKDETVLFAPHDFAFVADLFRDRDDVFRDAGFSAYLDLLAGIERPGWQRPCPDTIQAQLRPYQRVGFTWLCGLQRFGFGGILADDMGLGKTLQVLALLAYLKEKTTAAHTTLLIVPKSLIWNWAAEVGKFAPSLKLRLRTGPQRRTTDLGDLAGVDLVVTSYGLARQDIDLLTTVSWDLVILDEAQAIKNPDAMISKAVRQLPAANRLALTGTPIENRPLDLWSLFDFLMPGFLGDRGAFSSRFEVRDPEALALLGTLTAPFVLRRMKKQVCHELPTKTEVTLLCDFNADQRACYQEVLAAGKRALGGEADPTPRGGARRMQVLTLLLRLRQIACHPALVPASAGCRGSSGKLEAVVETALEILAGGYKILVFSQFVAHLELVREALAAHGVEQHALYGSTRRRQAVIEGFKHSDNASVFLISLKTGGVGLNLTEAGYVFLLDPWWNPAAENQAIDRSHRIGQEHPVTVYRFITRGSVEEKVSRLQARKRWMEAAVLGEGDGPAATASERELLALIQ